jgi:signal transduction histidine kinase
MKRCAREFLYIATSAPLGVAWFALLMFGYAIGIGLAGIPLIAALGLTRVAANSERSRAGLVLGAPIARPPRPRLTGRWYARMWKRLGDRVIWKELGYMLLLGPVGLLSGLLVMGLWAAVVAMLLAPAAALSAPSQSLLGGFTAGEFVGIATGGLALAALTIVLTRALATGVTVVANGLLAPDERALLAARVSALEETRAGAIESADARLRRLERDLHDGAQHRLAYIAMEIDRARGKLVDDPEGASELLGRAHEESKRAMDELRDLVRGIHPSVLNDRGLDAAISGLAERCPVPVAVDVRLAGRSSQAVEAAAYYVVAEALTNVGKHAGASSATVTIAPNGSKLTVEVRDDGHGGAVRTAGSGLEGLAQRVAALDGEFTIESPPGGPTTIRAELPCAS